VRLPRENLLAALVHWRLHLLILSITFGLFPLFGLGLATALPGLLPPQLWVGVLFLCALPGTVQSCIAFTSMARGNIAATVASAAASNLLGIVLTPLLIGLLAHAHGSGISFAGVWKIVLQLFLPFTVGHALRPCLSEWAKRQGKILALCDRTTIMLSVYSAFSLAVIGGIWHSVPVPTLLVLVGICLVMLLLAFAGTLLLARVLGFNREDVISIQLCGSLKSLVSGVPMARVLFTGPEIGAALLPIMIFHQMQLMVGAWLARRYGEDPR
jgi:sodium/bile acid cotransporter 7